MTLTCPTVLHQRRVRLPRQPVAAAEARSQVRAVLRAWEVPVDPDIAVLLTSDLVTNAITCGDGATVTLGIRCSGGQLRIDACDTSRALPAAVEGTADAKAGSRLVMVAALSTAWGCVRTAAGRSVYFTLAFRPDLTRGGDRRPGQFPHSAHDIN